jgi:hypothetical protein
LERVPRCDQLANTDLDGDFAQVYERSAAYTTTSAERMRAVSTPSGTCIATVAGDLVECGVWRGGSSMLADMTLVALGDEMRRVFLPRRYLSG